MSPLMNPKTCLGSIGMALIAASIPATLWAQMTVFGRVTSGDRPVQGATVAIPELRLDTRTIADGTYNFLIRSAQVRGQTVTIAARHRQLGSAAVQVALTGGSLEQNFVLSRQEQRPSQPPADPLRDSTRRIGVDTTRRAGTSRRTARSTDSLPAADTWLVATQKGSATIDSSALADAPAADLASALAGRFTGLLATGASTLGATSQEDQ